MTNSVDPENAAIDLFAKTYLSQYLGYYGSDSTKVSNFFFLKMFKGPVFLFNRYTEIMFFSSLLRTCIRDKTNTDGRKINVVRIPLPREEVMLQVWLNSAQEFRSIQSDRQMDG